MRTGLAVIAICVGIAALAAPASAAGGTEWLCKPGQADNPCLGPMGGRTLPPPGQSSEPLGYSAAADPPVDCFYVYPTQSRQQTPNATLAADPEIKAVAVNQARQFSRTCNVYAPLYRQYTLKGLAHITPQMRDLAYGDIVAAWDDYLKNYNHGRGVILIGHSQGSSHLARLITEKIDPDPQVRGRIVSAIIPGANVFVPKGKDVGGEFQNIPACRSENQIGCVIAYSMYLSEPGPDSAFGRVNTGYWANPEPRADPARFHVLCVNPAALSGDKGRLRPLADLAAFLGTPESAEPWLAEPDYYSARCVHDNGNGMNVDWLQVSKLNLPGDERPDLTSLIANGNNLHTGDINLALDNLVDVASSQASTYLRVVAAKSKIKQVGAKVSKVRRKLRRARRACRKAKRRSAGSARAKRHRVRSRCRPVKRARARVKKVRRKVVKLRRIVNGPEAMVGGD